MWLNSFSGSNNLIVFVFIVFVVFIVVVIYWFASIAIAMGTFNLVRLAFIRIEIPIESGAVAL
jgi:hypothetical protein